MVSVVVAGAAAGLVGSPHCVGMCGPFAAAGGGELADSVAWHAGRLASYALLGAAAGAFGAAIPGPGWVTTGLSALMLIGFSASVAGFTRPPHLALPGVGRLATFLARRRHPAARFAFGATVALLPCGLLYAALAGPVAAGDPLVGAAAMLAFGAAGSPVLVTASWGLRRAAAGAPWRRRALAVLVLIAGFGALAGRAPADVAEASCHAP